MKQICKICNKEFESDYIFNICNSEHIAKCANCHNEFIINRNTNWHTINMYITNQNIFCSNKCSIQYSKLQKFKEKYGAIIDDIRYDYENTSMQIKDIMKKYNLQQSTWTKLVQRFNLVRPDNLKKQMYSAKSKKQIEQFSDEKRNNWCKNLSIANKRAWKQYSAKKIEQMNIKRSLIKNETLNKTFKTKLLNKSFGKSKEEDNLYKELCNIFGSENVERQYTIGGFSFDFKITRKDKYGTFTQLVELNGTFYHNNKPFTGSTYDIEMYNNMKALGGLKAKIADKWRYTDVNKYNYCITHNLNLTVIYFSTKPQIEYNNCELTNIYNNIRKSKLDYTNVSKYNDIVYHFCYKEIFKNVIDIFRSDKIFKYLGNRIRYAYQNGRGCHIITQQKLLTDFNKYSSMYSTYTMHPIQNIRTFINEFGIKSIGDPFAGWGHRMIGAHSIDCKYVGCDCNEVQVQNLFNIKHFLNSINDTSIVINTGNSVNYPVSQYEYEAIFTCPPYYNDEIYSDKIYSLENSTTYSDFKNNIATTICNWINPNVKVIGIQFTNKYEDCIDELSNRLHCSYTKIPITKSTHHFHKNNKKYSEFIYIFKM